MSQKLWRLRINVVNGRNLSFSVEYLDRENEWIELNEYEINHNTVHTMIFDCIEDLVKYGYVQTSTVVNEGLGNIEILNYDIEHDIALLRICNCVLEPYVVAHGFDVNDGSWRAGTYYSNQKDSENDYLEILKRNMKG